MNKIVKKLITYIITICMLFGSMCANSCTTFAAPTNINTPSTNSESQAQTSEPTSEHKKSESPEKTDPEKQPTSEPTTGDVIEIPEDEDITFNPEELIEVPDIIEIPDVVDDDTFEARRSKVPDVIIDDVDRSGPSYNIKDNGNGTVTVMSHGNKYIVPIGIEISPDGVPASWTMQGLILDVNGDGKVDLQDAITLTKLIKIIGRGVINQNFDYTLDGRVDLSDVRALALYVCDPNKYFIRDASIPTYTVDAKAAISNCGFNEHGDIYNGKSGDQTKNEYRLQNWKYKNWTHVFRFNGDNAQMVRELIASLSIAAANNDHIGYDQGTRTSLWSALKKFNYNPANITSNVEADCSASTAAIIKATGTILNIRPLMDLSCDMSTANEAELLTAAGFADLSDDKYLTSSDMLMAGDVLLKDGHTCIVATNGEGVVTSSEVMHAMANEALAREAEETDTTSEKFDIVYTTVLENVKKGDRSDSALALQKALNLLGFKTQKGNKLTEDGDFGTGSIYALKKFQRKYKIKERYGTCAKAGETWLTILTLLLDPKNQVQQSDVGNSFSKALIDAGVNETTVMPTGKAASIKTDENVNKTNDEAEQKIDEGR